MAGFSAGMGDARPVAILTDIEGTTTPISFVRDVLFPYARARLPDFLARHGEAPEVAGSLREVRRLAPDRPALDALLDWMDQDAKITPLKTLQGLIWDEGYASGELKGAVYPDVPPVLRAWHEAGRRLYVYSSGSEAAQRLIFRHSVAGDLAGLFSGFFDTRAGAKREPASYAAIAGRIGASPGAILFLSDTGQELDAAAGAGLATCQLVRAEDGTVPWPGARQAADFRTVDALLT
jgi:enolase-phosphatase E1